MKRIKLSEIQSEVSEGQLLIDWKQQTVEIAERDFINYDFAVYDFVEVLDELKGFED